MDVGYPVSQFDGQLSGSEIARSTGASRPTSDKRCRVFVAPEQSVERAPTPPSVAPQRRAPIATPPTGVQELGQDAQPRVDFDLEHCPDWGGQPKINAAILEAPVTERSSCTRGRRRVRCLEFRPDVPYTGPDASQS